MDASTFMLIVYRFFRMAVKRHFVEQVIRIRPEFDEQVAGFQHAGNKKQQVPPPPTDRIYLKQVMPVTACKED
jgi:hypothetical protein